MKSNKILHAVLTAILAIGTVSLMAAQSAGSSNTYSSTARPNFANPDIVAGSAMTELNKAIATGNNISIVSALVKYSLAQNAISETFMPATLDKIDSVTTLETDPCVKSLLNLLQAKIYNGLYNRNTWKYDQRTTVSDTLPALYTEWSGEQFKQQIALRLDAALSDKSTLTATPLSDWADIMELNDESLIFYPSLYDMVAGDCISILSTFDSVRSSLPYRFLEINTLDTHLPTNARINIYTRKAIDLCADIIASHPHNSAPQIMARVKALDVRTARYYDSSFILNHYLNLYHSCSDSQWSCEALIAAANYNYGSPLDLNMKYATALREAIDRYPNYIRINALRQRLAHIEQPTVFLFTSGATPGVPFDLKLKISNARKVTVYFYYISPNIDNQITSIKLTPQLIANPSFSKTIELNIDTRPFSIDTLMSVTLDKPGQYFVHTTIDDEIVKPRTTIFDRLTCSEIIPITITTPNNDTVYPFAVNSDTGHPMEGVTISYKKQKSTPHTLGTTQDNGTTPTPYRPTDLAYTEFLYKKGTDALKCVWYHGYNSAAKKITKANIFTSLPLYHHGDSIQWALVAYSDTNGQRAVSPGSDITIKLNDVNGNNISSHTVTTDASGRACGSMILPEQGTSGQYYIIAQHDNNIIGTSYITVNDYKLPTFKVEIDDVKRSNDPLQSVSITCRATTYSSFPVADARTVIRLYGINADFWRSSRDEYFWETDTITDSDGAIKLNIPAEILDLSPYESKRYSITFDITSPSGESQSCSYTFSTGKPYSLRQQNTTSSINIDKPWTPIVTAVDAMNNSIDTPVRYKLIRDGHTVASIDNTSVPASITAGIYDIIAEPVDTLLADPITISSVKLYRNNGPSPTPDDVLFVPQTQFNTTDSILSIPLGIGFDNSYVLVTRTIDGKLISNEWITPSKGMQQYITAIPDDCHEVTLNFSSVRKGIRDRSTVIIKNQRIVKHLDINIESFRDKVFPESTETIRLSLTQDSIPTPGYLMMVMQSAALLNIHDSGTFALPASVTTFNRPSFSYSYGSSYSFGLRAAFQYATVSTYTWPSITQPQLQLYGMSFDRQFSRQRLMKSAARNTAIVVDDSIDDLGVVCENAPVAYSSGALEYAVNEEVATTDADTDAPTPNPDATNLRPSEIPLAFFAPSITTDTLGHTVYTYQVPAANTSWVLKAFAYTPELITSSFERQIAASRPLMVSSSTVRFLRYGDETTLQASVMNDTDSTLIITSEVSLLNPHDMSILTQRHVTDTIGGHSSAIVSLPVTAPLTGTALIFRIKSTDGTYTDGEQSLISLLPASQPVIKSIPFYVHPDSTSFSLDIDRQPIDSRVSLHAYTNPLWEILSALPSLTDDSPSTAIGAINRIYMASIAQGIMNRHPELKQGLKSWIESDRSDSTLTSMLARNDELKQLSIDATPWVRDAMSDTERLSSLALILDDKNLTGMISRNAKTLSDMTVSDGGIAWCNGYSRSSTWATYQVLTLAAILSERGYLPNSNTLSNVITSAIAYIDATTAAQYSRAGAKGDYTNYAFIRSILKAKAPTGNAAAAITATVNNILRRWEAERTEAKAVDAVILYHNRYPSMARKLVGSIKSYSMTSPERGTWWENTDPGIIALIMHTIASVTPDDHELINSIAQWLIINKTNNSWGNTNATATCVDALLGVLDTNRAANGTTTVSINGNNLHSNSPQPPGLIVSDITAPSTAGRLIISLHKDTGLPAMGGVIIHSIQAMDSITSSAHPSVSIRKQLMVTNSNTMTTAHTLNRGDRLLAHLTIHVTDDLDYVTIIDRHAACMEPLNQLSGYTGRDGLWFYREVTDSETRFYIERLPRGTYILDTEMKVSASGTFASGVATLQSQLNPSVVANSSGHTVTVK